MLQKQRPQPPQLPCILRLSKPDSSRRKKRGMRRLLQRLKLKKRLKLLPRLSRP